MTDTLFADGDMPARRLDDSVLLERLRRGEHDAYDELWSRHIGAALRLGRRLAPGRSEDLTSEAFLSVYRQVTTTDSGPTSAFRAYLFTVMRNTAMRWNRERERFDDFAEPEQVDELDALRIVEERADASELLHAFRSLPERWQRVLWLAEVEGAKRPQIAADLGIRLNAVSSLQRRARNGLRLQWLTRQVPAGLRDSPDHVASLLPAFVGGERSTALTRAMDEHLPSCRACSDVLVELRASSTRFQRTTLSTVGFAALGTVVSASPPAVSAAAALLMGGAGLGIGAIGTIAAGSIAAVTVGTLAVGLLTGAAPPSAIAPTTPVKPPAAIAPVPDEDAPTVDDAVIDAGHDEAREREIPTEPVGTGEDGQDELVEDAPRTGRHNEDPTVPNIDFGDGSGGSEGGQGWAYPDAPDPAPDGSVPDPDDSEPEDTSDPATDDDPASETSRPDPGLTAHDTGDLYLAPVLAGTAQPDNRVAVEFDGERYLPAVASDGAWELDLRDFAPMSGQPLEYRVWAFTDETASTATTGSFRIVPVSVEGFTDPQTPIPFDEASTTGVVISLQGPPNGTVCIGEMSGALATVGLDGNGRTTGRITVAEAAWYAFTLHVCAPDDDQSIHFGAPVEGYINAEDPTVPSPSPWGPGPDAITFDFPEL